MLLCVPKKKKRRKQFGQEAQNFLIGQSRFFIKCDGSFALISPLVSFTFFFLFRFCSHTHFFTYTHILLSFSLYTPTFSYSLILLYPLDTHTRTLLLSFPSIQITSLKHTKDDLSPLLQPRQHTRRTRLQFSTLSQRRQLSLAQTQQPTR